MGNESLMPDVCGGLPEAEDKGLSALCPAGIKMK